jgi:hypothetical protein
VPQQQEQQQTQQAQQQTQQTQQQTQQTQQQTQQAQQQAQLMAQEMQGKSSDQSVLIALSIVALAKQLSDLADLEKDEAKRDAMRANSSDIIKRAREVARLWPDKLYITVPPDWEPPNMLEPCPDCSRMRSKQERA